MMQKSKVQEMFPTTGHGVWWQAFAIYSCLGVFVAPVLVMIIRLIFGRELKDLGHYGVWAILGLIIGYLLANRSAKNYFFDVTQDAILVRSAEKLDFLRTIPFSKILDVAVRRVWGGQYIVEIISVKPADARHPLCHLYYFDKETAFALKEYILEKMKESHA